MNRHAARHDALVQALGLVAALLALAASFVAVQKRPAPWHELKLPIAELRSQANELALLSDLAERERVVPRFAKAHAGHLAKKVEQSRDELAAMRVEPPLAPARAEALPLAERLDAAVRQSEAKSPAVSTDTQGEALDALETQLQKP